MIRFIILVLLAVGVYYVYENQDELFANAKQFFAKEKTIMKVNDASAKKQKAVEDAMKQVLEY